LLDRRADLPFGVNAHRMKLCEALIRRMDAGGRVYDERRLK